MPGPLVTEIKSGRRRLVGSPVFGSICDGLAALSVEPSCSPGGSEHSDFCTIFPRLSWCDCSASIGWIPRYFRVSAVMFSRKWIFAAVCASFSTIATEVSSLHNDRIVRIHEFRFSARGS